MKRPLLLAFATLLLAAGLLPASAPAPASSPSPLISGWTELKEGEGAGTFEMDAKNPANPNPHLLRIAVTKYPDAGKGRYGVKNSATIAVQEGAAFDIQFGGASEGIGVGLVFSLETDDGKVLARTTLPEIGRGGATTGRGRGNGAGAGTAPARTPQAPWHRYLVSLTARGSAPAAHLTITPIEQVPVWIEDLTLTQRPKAQ